MEGISSRGQLTRGGLPACRLGVGLTTTHRKILPIRNISKRLGHGLICWLDISNGKRTNHREIGIDGVNWIRLAHDRVRWRTFVSTVMNLRLP